MSSESEVLSVVSDGVLTITLNRPERRNALTGPLAEQLRQAFDRASGDDTVQAVLLHGAGGAFCSGLDLKYFQAESPPSWVEDFSSLWLATHRAIFGCRKPIVGALERYAINGGASLALACDLLVVGEKAFLQVGEIHMGMHAPMNLAWLRLRHPESTAARLALVGDRLPGPKLVELGVATESVADDDVLERARETAMMIGKAPNGVGARLKTTIRSGSDDPFVQLS